MSDDKAVLLKDGFYFDEDTRYGRRYKPDSGYYGILVGDRPAMHIYQMRQYTIDVYQDDDYVTTITCEHGEY